MPKIVDWDERREQIVETTWRLISSEGLAAATMRRVAEQANCTTGLVTHYFSGKDELLQSVVSHVSRRARHRMVAATDGTTGLATLRACLLASVPLDEDTIAEWRVWLALWAEASTGGTLAKEWWRRAEGWTAILRNGVTQAVDAGDLPAPLDLEIEVSSLSALIYGLSIDNALSPARTSPAALTAIIDQHLRRMLVPLEVAPATEAPVLEAGA